MKRKTGRKLKIRGRITLYFVVLLTIPILILGIYSYRESKANLEQQSILALENNLSNLTAEINARCEREATYIKYQAYNLRFRKILELTPVDRIRLAFELNNSVEPILWYYIISDDYVKNVCIMTERIDTNLGSFLLPADTGSEWYNKSTHDLSTSWYFQDNELFISRAIMNSNVDECIGVMRIDLYPSTFLSPFGEYSYLGNGILVVDREGNVVYSRNTEGGAVDETVHRAIQDGSVTDRSTYILRQSTVEACGWKIFFYVDKEMVYGQMDKVVIKTFQVVSAVILITLILISLFSRHLSNRILLLKHYAELVSAGDLNLEIETNDSDEIGIVINSFGAMTKRLNQTINELYTVQLEKKAVELKALQAQINPHFLYNTLSSIKWKAIRSGNDEISDIAGLIAKFYRTSLNSGDQFTTVENELSNIKAYIEIQRHMHEFPFEVEYNIDPSVLQYRMLNFILQPIVENAFAHGIDYTDELRNGKLIIDCSVDGKYLLFVIKNNGPVLQKDRVEESLKHPGKSYGMFNIQERISLYYGEDCGLSGDVDEDGFTCFTVKILKISTNDEGPDFIK